MGIYLRLHLSWIKRISSFPTVYYTSKIRLQTVEIWLDEYHVIFLLIQFIAAGWKVYISRNLDHKDWSLQAPSNGRLLRASSLLWRSGLDQVLNFSNLNCPLRHSNGQLALDSEQGSKGSEQRVSYVSFKKANKIDKIKQKIK